MIHYIEDPKNSTNRLVHLITKFSLIAGYKVNSHKPIAFLYPNYKLTEREIKEQHISQ